MVTNRQTQAKHDRVIEAVRCGLDGDAAVEFIHRSGHAIAAAGIARHLRTMGGRGRVQELIDEGKTNVEILQVCFPDDDFSELERTPPTQPELFDEELPDRIPADLGPADAPLYETSKLTIRVPSDLFEAIRLAARAENKTQNQLIVDILTSVLARMPGPVND